MTLDELLIDLRQRKIELAVEGDQLRYQGPLDALTPELLTALNGQKAELMAFLRATALASGDLRPALRPVPRRGPLPLSFAQQRLWVLDQLEPDTPTYNIPNALLLNGALDVSALERSLSEIVRRHEVLRTRFPATDDGQPVQVIAPHQPVPLVVTDLRGVPPGERQAEAHRLIREEARRPFQLATGPLMRIQLLRLGEHEHVLLLNVHHIVSDGWSWGVLIGELSGLYQAFTEGRPSPWPELPVQYADFACWQRQWLRGDVLENQLVYWRRQLAGSSYVLELPSDHPRPPVTSYRGATLGFRWPADLVERLKELSRQEGVTLYMTLLAAFQTLLYRYSGQEDILVGSPSAGRDQVETEGLIGFFVNTLVLRGDLSGNPSFRTLLQRVREAVLGALAHQDIPFEKLVEELQPTRDVRRAPLCQVTFALQNTPVHPVQLPGLTAASLPVDSGAVAFDLMLDLEEIPDGMRGEWGYCTALFDEERMRRMTAHFRTLLEGLVAAPDQAVPVLPLLDAAERHQLLERWNDTRVDYPAGSCLHELIEAQAHRSPAAAAVAFEGQQFSYQALDERASRLAHFLRDRGVKPETRVGLLLERSLEMVMGLLGILKAGGAYVPLDPELPQGRLLFMLDDAQVSMVLTQQNLATRISGDRAAVICLDTPEYLAVEAKMPAAPLASGVTAKNLAYVIYTSGSTGRPKGVAVEHRQIVNYVRGIAERIEFGSGWNFALVSTIAADLGNTMLFPALSTGGCLHVISRERASDPALLGEYFERHNVDCLKIVPAHLAALLGGPRPEKVLPRRRLILGGETSRCDWVAGLQALAPQCEIFNHYGPTETTVGVLTNRVGRARPVSPSGTLLLGRPLPNAEVYILDAQRRPVPIGVTGELFIGGRGVARGYLNDPELTAERFVPHPFDPHPEARLYRSGDRARYLADGSVEFLGRMDQQVKIRGFRIELGEIETALKDCPGVREAVVTARKDEAGGSQLVAYIMPRHPHMAIGGNHRPYQLPNRLRVAHLNKNETDYMYREIFELQAYLRHGITIKDGDCVFDVGANIGLFTVFVNQLGRRLTVYAFEPNPIVFDILRANAAAHGTGVKPMNCGLSNENRTAELTFYEGFSLLSGFYADPETEKSVVRTFLRNQQRAGSPGMAELVEHADDLLDERFTARTLTARLRTLSSVIAEEKVEQIDLLKINVEKSEWDVLQGVRAEDWQKIRQMVIEVDRPENRPTLVALLEQQGFETVVEQDVLLDQTPLCYVYAIRPDGERRLIREQAAGVHRRPLPVIGETDLSAAALQQHVRHWLPEHMVPVQYVFLDELPRTPNGKIDRRALPAPDRAGWATGKTFVAPRTSVEQVVARTWSEVLRLPRVGIHDNFFELGGHSLLAVQVASRLRASLEVDFPLRSIFEKPTVAELASHLDNLRWAKQAQERAARRPKTLPEGVSLDAP